MSEVRNRAIVGFDDGNHAPRRSFSSMVVAKRPPTRALTGEALTRKAFPGMIA